VGTRRLRWPEGGRVRPLDSERIHLVDALRGFALAGIVALHFMEQYLGEMPPPGHESYSRHGGLDDGLEALAFLLLRGKGFALFSFMFGLSFALQMQRAEARDSRRDFRPRFTWRLAILLGIGWLHSLVYRGDILMVYAMLGVPLMLFRRVPDRWLWALALALMLGGPRVVMRLTGPRPAPAELAAVQAAAEARATRHYEALRSGEAARIARLNATEGFASRMSFQFGPFSRAYQTFGYFLIGLWAGRRRVLEDPEAHLPLLRRALRASGALTLGIPAAALLAWLAGRFLAGGAESPGAPAGPPDVTSWPFVVGMSVYDAWNFAGTVLYLSAFVLLFRRDAWRRRLLSFAPVGRMALTSYVVESLLGAAVFFGVGLGALGRVGHTVALPVGLALFAGQMWVSRLWLGRFRYGPLEWGWRSLTLLRAQPFVRAGRPLEGSAEA